MLSEPGSHNGAQRSAVQQWAVPTLSDQSSSGTTHLTDDGCNPDRSLRLTNNNRQHTIPVSVNTRWGEQEGHLYEV